MSLFLLLNMTVKLLIYVCMLYVWMCWGWFLMVPVSGYCDNSKNLIIPKKYVGLPQFDLISLIEQNRPFTVINNSCDYYQSSDVKNMLIQDQNALSLLCMNCQGLKAHWESFGNLLSNRT